MLLAFHRRQILIGGKIRKRIRFGGVQKYFFLAKALAIFVAWSKGQVALLPFAYMKMILEQKILLGLVKNNQLYKTGDFYEGLIFVNTMTEKDWNVAFEVECENGVMMPTKMIINFMDKNILIL